MAGLVARSFTVLSREQSEAFARLCERLEGLSLDLQVGDEHFAVAFSQGRAHVRDMESQAPVRLSTSRHAILDLLEARLTLPEAVLVDAVEVVGPIDVLLRFHEGLGIYLHGAVRSPGFPMLLQHLRETCRVSA